MSGHCGPCVVMEVRSEDVVVGLRKLCGPHNPADARNINPNSIRALYGSSLKENAVHCTDLPEDGQIECEYFFTLIKQKPE